MSDPTSARPQDFADVRKEYADAGLDLHGMGDDPIEEFKKWYQIAKDRQSDPTAEPNAMALASCGSDGRVTNRIVLLKGVELDSLLFFTNYNSTKGRQIAENSQVAATFHWHYLGRQVRVEGIAEKTEREISEKYFHSRPRGAQLSAAVSPQSNQVGSRDELKDLAESLDQQHMDQPIPLPENWGGYRIKVQRIEFWQGRPDRCHDRVVYQLDEKGWGKIRIAP